MFELNEEYEQSWLNSCLNSPELITMLPVTLYHKFFDYLVQEERWQDVFKITQVKDKIVYQTVEEVMNGAQGIYSSRWTPEQARRQLDRLVEEAIHLSDFELAQRVELLFDCTPVEYMISSQRLDIIIKQRIIEHCEKQDIGVSQYNGPFQFKYYKNLFF